MVTESRRGQALMELAVGMFSIALIVTALAGFAVYIAKSLAAQNELRAGKPSVSDSVDVGAFGASYVFGSETLTIRESVKMPRREILQ